MYPSIAIEAKRQTPDGLCVAERMLLEAFEISPPERGSKIEVDLGLPGVEEKLEVFRTKLQDYFYQNLSWKDLSSRPHCDKTGKYALKNQYGIQLLSHKAVEELDKLIEARETIVHPSSDHTTNLSAAYKDLRSSWTILMSFTETLALFAGSVKIDDQVATLFYRILYLGLLDDEAFRKQAEGVLTSSSIMQTQKKSRQSYNSPEELGLWFSIVIRLYAIEINSPSPQSMSQAIYTILAVLQVHVQNSIDEASGKKSEMRNLLSLQKAMEDFSAAASFLYDIRTNGMGPDAAQVWENLTPEEKVENKKNKILELVKMGYGRVSLKTLLSLGKPFDVDVRQICAASADPELNELKDDLRAEGVANNDLFPELLDPGVGGIPTTPTEPNPSEIEDKEIANEGLARFILSLVLVSLVFGIACMVIGASAARIIMVIRVRVARDSIALLHKSSVVSAGLNVSRALP